MRSYLSSSLSSEKERQICYNNQEILCIILLRTKS